MTNDPEIDDAIEQVPAAPTALWVERDGRRVEVPIKAVNTEEYLALLRGAFKAAGRTAGSIAKYTHIPRSTVYSFTSPKKPALPKYREQLEAFLKACKLTDPQVRAMLQLWAELKEQPAVEDEVLDGELVEGAQVGELIPLRKADAASGAGTELIRASEIGRLLDRTRSGELGMDGLVQSLQRLAGQNGDVHVHGNISINVSSRTESTTNTVEQSAEHASAGDDAEGRGATGSAQQRPKARKQGRLRQQIEALAGSSLLGDEKSRFRNLLVLMMLVALIVFGMVAVVFPDRALPVVGIILIIGTVGVTLIKMTYRKH